MSPSQHIVKSYDEELQRLTGEIVGMGELARRQLIAAIAAVENRDNQAARKVPDDDDLIDQLEQDVSRDVVQLLVVRSPMARDLREVVAALRIASDYERIGDYAANIAKRALVLNESPLVKPVRILPRLARWAGRQETRLARVRETFGVAPMPWDSIRVLERYELLYEAGLIAEHYADRGETAPDNLGTGTPLAYDHRRIAASALGRLRGKLTYRPVVFELLPETFTLTQLQRTVEALVGQRLHKQNFRRLVEQERLVEGTGQQTTLTGGRPAELFRFREEVRGERPRAGLRLPGR